jgi:NADH-quinone oxidoreductase subunit A
MIHAVICVALCLAILLIVYFINTPKPNSEKNIAYECGFKPFDFGYYPFDVQFYRVGILFLLFDVEIIFFFPWVLNFYQITYLGHTAILIFICLLFFGFIYEVKSKALN